MSVFEYVSVVLSIVIALGVGEVLGGLGMLLQNRRQVRSAALFVAWCVLILLFHIGWWFAIWNSLAGHSSVELPAFLPYFAMSCFLFLSARVMVPRAIESSTDLGDHLENIRVPFFLCLALMPLTGVVGSVGFGLAIFPGTPLNAFATCLAASGALVSNRKWQLALPGLWLAYFALLVAFTPGRLEGAA